MIHYFKWNVIVEALNPTFSYEVSGLFYCHRDACLCFVL